MNILSKEKYISIIYHYILMFCLSASLNAMNNNNVDDIEIIDVGELSSHHNKVFVIITDDKKLNVIETLIANQNKGKSKSEEEPDTNKTMELFVEKIKNGEITMEVIQNKNKSFFKKLMYVSAMGAGIAGCLFIGSLVLDFTMPNVLSCSSCPLAQCYGDLATKADAYQRLLHYLRDSVSPQNFSLCQILLCKKRALNLFFNCTQEDDYV